MNGVGVTDWRSDGARAAKSSPARFPTNVIGPLLMEGKLAIGCSCRMLVVRSLNGDYGIGGGVIGDVVHDGGAGVVGDGVDGIGIVGVGTKRWQIPLALS